MKYSLISPTFGRPEEVTEFLESLLTQDYNDFEVVLGDGTPEDRLRPELKKFEGNDTYPLTILYKEYLPVSDARNEAAKLAKGEYLIFLDSDCLIPQGYLKAVDAFLENNQVDLFGGPDAARDDFTNLQKAISFSMTSFITTGGIRGKKKTVGTYHPRGFNMGIRKAVFEDVNGYDENFKCGEDIELSMRILEKGYKSAFIENAHVYHKRRTSLGKFYKQVYRFGAARINLWQKHPSELKMTHLFPLAFSVFAILSAISAFGIMLGTDNIRSISLLLFLLFGSYLIAVYWLSAILNKSLSVGFLSIQTTLTMMFGYGWGFAKNFWAVKVLGKKEGIKL
ncbi:MAG: glycosyltransferase [Schleiferiaceae bacterium]|jgi:GT2 family glycosyltransferase|nr:glycosyltransferase [Schleiferiaceae bacterium]